MVYTQSFLFCYIADNIKFYAFSIFKLRHIYMYIEKEVLSLQQNWQFKKKC